MGWVFRATVTVAMLSTSASAKALPVTLIWLAPEGCPQQAEVWERLSERLGRVPSTPDETSFAARGEVVKTETGFKASLQTLTASGAGARSFTHPSCTEVTRMAVVALSLAIDPAIEPPPEVNTKSLWLGLGPTASVGLLPLPSPGLSAIAGFDFSPASFHLSVMTSLSQRHVRDDGLALNVGMPIGGSLDACIGIFGARLSVAGCAAVSASLMTAVPEGVERPRNGVAPLVSLGPRVRGRVLLHPRVALEATIDGAFALARPEFLLANGERAYAVSVFGVLGVLAVEFRVW